jgi:elongation factor Ts
MAVDPAKVKELRERSGCPMMDCKKALEKTAGDLEKAFDELRKAGLKAQEKLSGRAANDGKIGSYVSPDGKVGVLVALRCETEPVGKNEHFLGFLGDLVQAIAKHAPRDRAALESIKLASGETVGSALTELVNKIRENISIGKFARFEGDAIVQYVHFDKKKAAMVVFTGGATSDAKLVEVGKDLCMHIAHNKPESLSRDQIEKAVVDREREVLLATAKNDPKNAKKPEEIIKKIIEGQVEKFVAARCLLEQPFVKDEKMTVTQYIKQAGVTAAVTKYVYVATDQTA